MHKQVVYTEKEFSQLPGRIMRHILECAGKSYGVKFVSRESGEEETDFTTLFGLFVGPIEDALAGKRTESEQEERRLDNFFDEEYD